MENKIESLQDIVNNLPVVDEVKKVLFDKIASGKEEEAKQDIAAIMTEVVQEAEHTLADQQIEIATQNLSGELEEIDRQSQELYSELSGEMDELELEDARKAISQ